MGSAFARGSRLDKLSGYGTHGGHNIEDCRWRPTVEIRSYRPIVAHEMTHAQIDERSLKFDRLVAEKLRRNPRLIDLALVNIDRWLTSCADAVRPGLIEWKELLIRYRQSPDDVINTLLGTDDHSRRLRQSSPFCGPEIISPSERLTILQQKAG